MLATEANKRGLPVIVVNTYYPGISGFLSSIDQKVVVLFDEFEKTFVEVDDYDPQVEMLSLFDGFDNGRKLFVITCNSPNKLNEFFVNRPGRFHYHFSLDLPNDDEVREYLHDQLKEEYYDAIEGVVSLAHMTDVSYDYLRAIVFELNQGYSLEETMDELNITRTRDVYFDAVLVTSVGVYHAYSISVDFSSRGTQGCWMYGDQFKKIYCSFRPSAMTAKDGQLVITNEYLKIDRDDDDDWERDDEEVKAENKNFRAKLDNSSYLILNKSADMNKRFAV